MERRIGAYELLEELGRGGMGVVYRARHAQLEREVALKLLLADDADEGARARFLTEARAAGQLSHPNLVPVTDAGWDGPNPFLVMELVAGETLGARLKRGPLPIPEAVAHVEGIARGIAHAHERGILHRDIKPSNVILSERGCPRVADFGLAKDLGRDERLTQTGTMMGTPEFASPEQLDGDLSQIGPATDVYGLGATLFALLSGRAPFQGTGRLAVVSAVLSKDPPPLRELRPEVSPPLAELVARCLRKEPAQRPPSAAALADELASLAALGPASHGGRRDALLLVGLGALVLALGLGLAGYSARGPQPQAGPEPSQGSSLSASPSSSPPRPPASPAPSAPPLRDVRWRLVSAEGLPPRELHAAAWVAGELVVFGGRAGGRRLNDLRAWDGQRWRLLAGERPPPPRYSHALGYDPRRETLVLYGGKAKGWLGDLWEWRAGRWTQREPPQEGPGKLCYHDLVYSPSLERLVTFAAYGSVERMGSVRLWSWDGSNWEALTPLGLGRAPRPATRMHSSLAFLRGELFLHAGVHTIHINNRRTFQQPFKDLWAWSAKSGWRQELELPPFSDSYATLAATPAGLVVYEPSAQRTWLLAPSGWHELSAGAAPSARERPTLTYDPRGRRALLIGGRSGGRAMGDVWELPLGAP